MTGVPRRADLACRLDVLRELDVVPPTPDRAGFQDRRQESLDGAAMERPDQPVGIEFALSHARSLHQGKLRGHRRRELATETQMHTDGK